MKRILLSSILVVGCLFGNIIETKRGTVLEIFDKADFKSEIKGKVLVDEGDLDIRRCEKKKDITWCRVRYGGKDISIRGYVDKQTLNKLFNKKKNKKYFKTTFGGKYDDVAKDVIPEKDGGFTIIGYTKSFGHGVKDIYVIRVDKYGNKILSKAFGGSYEDEANAALRLKDGTTLLVGNTKSLGNSSQSIYVGLLRKDLTLKWHRGLYYDGDDYYTGKGIVPVSNRSFLIAGTEEHIKFFGSQIDGVLFGIRKTGKLYAFKRIGGKDDDYFNSIIKVKDGFVLAGKTDTWGHGDDDAYVVKVNKRGQQIFAKVFGYKRDEVAEQIIQSNDGGYILIGSTNSDYDTQKDIFVVKMRANGKKVWQYRFGSKKEDGGYSITRAHGGGYILAGYTKNTRGANKDLYIIKIDENGNPIWERKYGGNKDDVAYKIKTIPDGYVIVGYHKTFNSRGKDVFLLKVDKNGRIK